MGDKQIPNERRQYEYKSVFTYTDNTSDNNDKIMENLHKQIIIDGVDISGCGACSFNMDGCFYECKVKGFYTDCSYTDCEDNPNCNYKLYKRKEQECEELKEANNTLTVTREKLLGDLWIAEESLKDYKAHYDRQCDELGQLKAELEQEKALKETYLACYKAKHEDIESALFKLKQTLTEIKEIVEKAQWDYRMPKEVWDLILQKISEVVE